MKIIICADACFSMDLKFNRVKICVNLILAFKNMSQYKK